jgi:hypothetical protein
MFKKLQNHGYITYFIIYFIQKISLNLNNFKIIFVKIVKIEGLLIEIILKFFLKLY